MFGYEWAGQIAWLIPAAAVLFIAGLWLTRRQPRVGRLRAGLLLWGGWALVTWATFSFASGIIHEYYAVALAPALAAVVGIGAALCWRLRSHPAACWSLAVALSVSSLYAMWLNLRNMYLNADDYGGDYAGDGLYVCDWVDAYLDTHASSTATITDLVYNNNIACYLPSP